MFNIGPGELIVIAVAALLVLGPQRLPELARTLGKFLREFRRQTEDVRNMVEREFYRMDQDVKRAVQVDLPSLDLTSPAEPSKAAALPAGETANASAAASPLPLAAPLGTVARPRPAPKDPAAEPAAPSEKSHGS